MMKIINIPIREENFFHTCVLFLNPLFKLRDREIDVLAELLKYYWKYRNYDEEVQDKMVFDYDTKIKILDTLKMSKESFDNNITRLRKRNIVVGRHIPRRIRDMINPDDMMLIMRFTSYDNR